MDVKLAKVNILELYCCLRQGERSVDNALAAIHEWQRFTEFYDSTKRDQLERVIALVKSNLGPMTPDLRKRPVSDSTFNDMVGMFVAYVCNPWKQAWLFTDEEIARISSTLTRLSSVIRATAPPASPELIGLRMDCYFCQSRIKRKLRGVRELETVDNIEHFNQSNYRKYATYSDLSLQWK